MLNENFANRTDFRPCVRGLKHLAYGLATGNLIVGSLNRLTNAPLVASQKTLVSVPANQATGQGHTTNYPQKHSSFESRYDQSMLKDGETDAVRICHVCGQKIPSMSKLAIQQDGKDICLQCQIRDAQINKGLRH